MGNRQDRSINSVKKFNLYSLFRSGGFNIKISLRFERRSACGEAAPPRWVHGPGDENIGAHGAARSQGGRMSTPFIGEIQIVGYNFAPVDWAVCDGQTIPVSENPALYSLLGNTYGGAGQTTFGIPDLRGRAMVGYGNYYSPYFDATVPYAIGQLGGTTDVTLSESELPAHLHELMASADLANRAANRNGGAELAEAADSGGGVGLPTPGYATATDLTSLPSSAVSSVGGGGSHSNVQPTLALLFVIALDGIYPQRN